MPKKIYKMSNQFSLLKTKRFLPIFLTQFFGALNDNIFKNATIIFITYKLSQNINVVSLKIIITIATGIFILPFFLFSGLAGQLSEKFEKARLTKIVKFIEILLMSSVVLGFYFKSITMLMIVLFFMGVQSTFFGPLKYSILPEQLQDKELIDGNALVSSTTFLSILLGTIIGGFCIMLNGGIYVVSIVVISIAVLGYISSKFIPIMIVREKNMKINYNIFSNTFDLIRNLVRNKIIFLSAIGISWFWFIGATFVSQFPNFVKFIIGGNQEIIILFFSVFSIGIAFGSLLAAKILKNAGYRFYIPITLLGISIFSFDLYLSGICIIHQMNLIGLQEFLCKSANIRLVFDLFGISVFGGMYIVPLYTVVQKESGKNDCPKIIAGLNVMDAMFMVASTLSISFILKYGFSVIDIFLFLSIANLFFVLLYLYKAGKFKLAGL